MTGAKLLRIAREIDPTASPLDTWSHCDGFVVVDERAQSATAAGGGPSPSGIGADASGSDPGEDLAVKKG